MPSKKAKRLRHNFYDPSKLIGTDKEKPAAFLKPREEIKAYFKKFVEENLASENVS
jgi:arsenate reductase